MIESIQLYFRELADTYPKWNFIFFYEPIQFDRLTTGLWLTLELSVICVVLSIVIGLVGAWLQRSHSKIVRSIVQGYIQFFRNTPPLVQLLIFYLMIPKK